MAVDTDSLKKEIEELIVPTDGKLSLSRFDPGSTAGMKDKKTARKLLKRLTGELQELQELLYAESKHALLVVFQAMGTGGKDSTIRHVLGPLNPQGVRVSNFKVPSAEEAAHDYLWRIHKSVPARGMIGVFNRSHYEEVLTLPVHQLISEKDTRRRYGEINDFEQYLSANGVSIVKFYLHISKDEQKERLQSRLDRPDKHWKFSSADVAERKLWDTYQKAYESMLKACSTEWAPWYVIPANKKWYRDCLVATVILETLRNLKMKYPPPEPGLDEIRIDD